MTVKTRQGQRLRDLHMFPRFSVWEMRRQGMLADVTGFPLVLQLLRHNKMAARTLSEGCHSGEGRNSLFLQWLR